MQSHSIIEYSYFSLLKGLNFVMQYKSGNWVRSWTSLMTLKINDFNLISIQ